MKQHIPKNAYFWSKLRKTDFSFIATTKISFFVTFSKKGPFRVHHVAIADTLIHEEDLYDLTGHEYRDFGWYETLNI